MGYITDKHREEWLFIKQMVRKFKKENPTVSQRKIAKQFEISVGVVNKYLKNLHM